jgi:pyrroloquinoline quinone biosynthesis protein B
MKIRVLGSAAGGGFPQWNCNCRNCKGVRDGSVRARPRTQSSIAVSGNGVDWILINASPDLLTQVRAFPGLQPARALRDSAISAVLLIDSQIDHTTGLLMLRESKRPLDIYCTAMVREDLTTGNPIFNVLRHYCDVNWHEIAIHAEQAFTPIGAGGLRFTALPLTSKAPPYSPHRNDPHPGDNIGVRIDDPTSGKTLFYAPGLAEVEAHLVPHMAAAHCLMVDGTCYTNDEMITQGLGSKRSLDMGHLPQSGPGGMIEQLRRFASARRVLIHINNSNPILDEDSAARRSLDAEGIDVAYDGMEIEL